MLRPRQQQRHYFEEQGRFLKLIDFLNTDPRDEQALWEAVRAAEGALYIAPPSESDALPTRRAGHLPNLTPRDLARIRMELDEILAALVDQPEAQQFRVTAETTVSSEAHERTRRASEARQRLNRIIYRFRPILETGYSEGEEFHLSFYSEEYQEWPFWAALTRVYHPAELAVEARAMP